MSSRTSTRQAAASSPPRNQQAARTRNMRSRSASVDLGAATQTGRRTKRQGSAGSVASNTSTSKGKGKGKGKGVKASAPDLSVLNEDSENDSEPGSDQIEELNFDFDDLESLRDDSSQVAASKESQLKADEMKSNAKKLKETMKAANKPVPVEKAIASSSRPAKSGPSKASSSRNNQVDTVPGSSNEEILHIWRQNEKDNNKENNRPIQKAQPQQAQEERGGPSKRSREDEEEDEDEDDAFQKDDRPADPARRPAAARPAKRARVEESESSDDQPRRRREESVPAELEDELEDEPDDEPEAPPMSAQVKAVAKVNVQNASMTKRQPQIRQRWSAHDEEELIRLIGEEGCGWARLVELGEWEVVRPNFQVQLKDKARNIKVSYLKSGTPLPPNFELVRLGKKEIKGVQQVYPEYEQD